VEVKILSSCWEETVTGPYREQNSPNILFFYGGGFSFIRTTTKLNDYPFSAVRDCLFRILLAAIHRLLHPEAEDALWRGSEGPTRLMVHCWLWRCHLPWYKILPSLRISQQTGHILSVGFIYLKTRFDWIVPSLGHKHFLHREYFIRRSPPVIITFATQISLTHSHVRSLILP